MPHVKPIDDPEVLRRVSREAVAACLDVTVRHLHSLVERGVLPAPTSHGDAANNVQPRATA